MKKLLLGAGVALVTAVGYGFYVNVPLAQADEITFVSPPLNEIAPLQGVKQTVVIDGLERPWSVAWLPESANGEMLITEKPGRLRLVRAGKLVETPIAGTPEVFSSGQGALMDVSLHPDFERNNLIYLTYSAGNGQANGTRLMRARLDLEELALRDASDIFSVAELKPGGQHFGSRLAWLPDGTLLMTIGDGGNPPVKVGDKLARFHSQDAASHLGKVLRLTDEGRPAPDNPFVNQEGARPEVWRLGHRNIQGLLFDPATNRVWANEHGARGGDELNLLSKGGNGGWPDASYSREYSTGVPVSQPEHQPTFDPPRLAWTPSPGASGLALYRGDKFPAWNGNLFSGGLATKDIRRVVVDERGRVTAQERLDIGSRVRDVRVGPDGFLYYLTDDRNGQLVRLEPA